MPIRIEAGAKTLRDDRLTPIRVISTLYDRRINGDTGLKAGVKKAMLAKGVDYAEDDSCVAMLRSSSSHGEIDARKLYALIKAGKLTLDQFLDSVKVEKKPLQEFLPGGVIDDLSAKIRKPSPSLVTDFKEHVEFGDAEALIAELVKSTLRRKAA